MFCFPQEWVLRPGNNLVFLDFICDSFVNIFAEQNINSCLPQSLFSTGFLSRELFYFYLKLNLMELDVILAAFVEWCSQLDDVINNVTWVTDSSVADEELVPNAILCFNGLMSNSDCGKIDCDMKKMSRSPTTTVDFCKCLLNPLWHWIVFSH